MTVIEFIDNLILDMTDYIHDYENDIKQTDSHLEKYEKKYTSERVKRVAKNA